MDRFLVGFFKFTLPLNVLPCGWGLESYFFPRRLRALSLSLVCAHVGRFRARSVLFVRPFVLASGRAPSHLPAQFFHSPMC